MSKNRVSVFNFFNSLAIQTFPTSSNANGSITSKLMVSFVACYIC